MDSLAHATDLDREILNFIRTTPYGAESDAAFTRLAQQLFEFQFEKNRAYRRFCENRGATPSSVKSWEDMPPVSTQTFKQLPLTVFPHAQAVRKLQTSGTSSSGITPGTVYLDEVGVAIYTVSHQLNGDALVYAGSEHPKYTGIFLLPHPNDKPNMGIVHGMPAVVKSRTDVEHFLITPNGLDTARLCDLLRDAEKTGKPVVIMGASFGFVHFFDYCADEGLSFELPPGSLYADGGGFKGASREIARDELFAMVTQYLGIPRDHIVNCLGMTEVHTTFWDNNRFNEQKKKVTDKIYKLAPPWARVMAVDPETMQRVPTGQHGLLRYVTLANRSTVMAVQTDDVGFEVEDGFDIIGRAKGAAPRGCSISIDELIGSPKGQ
jgi:anaerobic magnesium-protoporphyrin IX monomethyl ester cyclase